MVLSSILTVVAGMQAGLILVLPIQLVLILLKPWYYRQLNAFQNSFYRSLPLF